MFRIFTCCPLIFLSFKLFYKHRFFFSLLVVLPFILITKRFTSAGILLAKAKLLSKMDLNTFNWYLRAFRNFLFEINHWVPIFCSLKNAFLMGKVLEHSWSDKCNLGSCLSCYAQQTFYHLGQWN
jgi:hypothetical protein